MIPASPTFLDLPQGDDLAAPTGPVILGAPYGVPYPPATAHSHASEAPQAIRAQSLRLARHIGNVDFDLGGAVTSERLAGIMDLGDVPRAEAGQDQHALTEAVVARIVGPGGIPFVLGGDHSVPIPVMRAVAARQPFHLVQFDAHLDVRDEVNGIRDGLSSSIRRAMELDGVTGITQLGIRGLGSARPADVAAAEAHGNRIVLARAVEADPGAALVHIPDGTACYITFDMDAMDPAVAPGVIAPAFGGLRYETVVALLLELARRCRVVGMDVVEVAPGRDVHGITALLAARLLWLVLASIRAG